MSPSSRAASSLVNDPIISRSLHESLARMLRNNPVLRRLNVSDGRLQGSDITCLLQALTKSNINSNSNNSTLQSLIMTKNHMDNASMIHMATILPHLHNKLQRLCFSFHAQTAVHVVDLLLDESLILIFYW